MAKKMTSPELSPPAQQGKTNSPETRPPEVVELLAKVGQLLDEGQAGRALDVIAQSGVASPWATNALGVCQLRLGNAKVAIDVFRGLVLGAGGLVLRRDVPVVFRTNYATALLVSGNLSGGLTVLNEIGDEANPGVGKLRAAVRRWKGGLTFWQRLNWWMGGEPAHPFALDFPPGDLA
jgi:hypothetical protein